MAVRNMIGIDRLVRNTHTNTKLVIGIRNPVLFFQSFYNYRITELYNRGLSRKNIPPPESLIGNKSWKQVSTDLAQYEFSLMQLAKVTLMPKELLGMASKGLILTPNPYKVFLYSIDQLEDDNESRTNEFRADMQRFLELQDPIEPFPHENKNHAVHYPEHMDICSSRYDNLRQLLIAQAKGTQKWIREKFLQSNDVTVGGKANFLSLISQWSHDPCASTD